MDSNLKVSQLEGKPAKVPYQELTGSLLCLSCNTRPDISFAISVLSGYNSNYQDVHWNLAKRVLRYLKGTMNIGLVFKKATDVNLNGYVDAGFVFDDSDGLSYRGQAFMLGKCLISWESRKLKSVALSSTEAEYLSLSES
ncbi:secreted RxLR effector protein 161-like [Ischnura elegans]|uniref:secreted RxLR effector protein 161-like n=1 Tax=Ischnura elegans TaxID=197161 RepID=UPI001ED87957|nr:secreted RxLR effector protein 161-like [Ischnura elegans]